MTTIEAGEAEEPEAAEVAALTEFGNRVVALREKINGLIVKAQPTTGEGGPTANANNQHSASLVSTVELPEILFLEEPVL